MKLCWKWPTIFPNHGQLH